MTETDDVWSQVCREWSKDLPPTNESLANAENLLHRLKRINLLPKLAERGYWPTTILTWGDKPIELEVFESGYELYVYPPWSPGPSFEVHNFEGQMEENLSQLVEKLKSLLG